MSATHRTGAQGVTDTRNADLRPRCMECGAPIDMVQLLVRQDLHLRTVNYPCDCAGGSLDFRHLAPGDARGGEGS